MEYTNDLSTKEKLDEMANMDIREIDANSLIDLEDVVIKQELPVKERVEDYIRQVKNPYCYKCHGVVVKIAFNGDNRLSECLENLLNAEK